MASFLADSIPPAGELAAAIARHPASGLPRFRGLVGLLTGDWRVGDPEGFAATLTGAPRLAGHPVHDLVSGGRLPAGCDGVIARAAHRPELDIRWVSARQSGALFVEARAQAPAGPGGPELFVLAHLVEHLGPGGGRRASRADHSWIVIVIGDRVGGVAAVVRATLSCPAPVRCCPPPAASVRLPLAALRETLLAPALDAEEAPSGDAQILPFPAPGS